MKLSLSGIQKAYARRGGERLAIEGVDLEVESGQFVSLLGPSGCGKSTLLHIMAGLEPPSAGSVTLAGDAVLGPGRELGLVFQQPTLFPWLNVAENVAFPGTLASARRAVPPERAEELLRLVGLWEFRDSYPHELSGGMQQRAVIARALAAEADVLLMDEPFGALDAQTREEMQELLLELTRLARTTTVFVTHDVDEALFLSDRVVVLSQRPARVLADLSLPSARAPRGSRERDPEYVQRRREVLDLLRAERRTEKRP